MPCKVDLVEFAETTVAVGVVVPAESPRALSVEAVPPIVTSAVLVGVSVILPVLLMLPVTSVKLERAVVSSAWVDTWPAPVPNEMVCAELAPTWTVRLPLKPASVAL